MWWTLQSDIPSLEREVRKGVRTPASEMTKELVMKEHTASTVGVCRMSIHDRERETCSIYG